MVRSASSHVSTMRPAAHPSRRRFAASQDEECTYALADRTNRPMIQYSERPMLFRATPGFWVPAGACQERQGGHGQPQAPSCHLGSATTGSSSVTPLRPTGATNAELGK